MSTLMIRPCSSKITKRLDVALPNATATSTNCWSPPWLAITASFSSRKPPETRLSLVHLRSRSAGDSSSCNWRESLVLARTHCSATRCRTNSRAVASIGWTCWLHFQASNFTSSSTIIKRVCSPSAVTTTASMVVVLYPGATPTTRVRRMLVSLLRRC